MSAKRLTIEFAIGAYSHGRGRMEAVARITASDPSPELEREMLRVADRWAGRVLSASQPRTLAEAWAGQSLEPRKERA